MADAGHAGYTAIYDGQQQANDKWAELNGWNIGEGSGGLMGTSSSRRVPAGPAGRQGRGVHAPTRSSLALSRLRLQGVVELCDAPSDEVRIDAGAEVPRGAPGRAGAVPRHDERRRLMAGRSSRRTILIVAAVAVVMAAGGFLAAKLVISPEDAAARTAAPAAGPITVPVEPRRRWMPTSSPAGDIGFTGSVEVKLAPAGPRRRRSSPAGFPRSGRCCRERHGAARGHRAAGDRAVRGSADLPQPGRGQHWP